MKHIRNALALLLAVSVAIACLTTASAYEVNGSVLTGINAASLDLAESIGIRFYVQASKLTSYVASYLEVAFDANRDGVAETITITPEANTVTLNGKAYAEYILKGVAPDNMGTSLTAQLFVVKTDGYAYSGGSRTYSVKDYILNVMGAADYDTCALLADLTAYGYAAEAYTGKGSLPSSGAEYTALTDLIAAYGRTQTMADTDASDAMMLSYPTGVNVVNAKVTFRTVGLNLRDNAGILYTFSPANGEKIADYTLKVTKNDRTYTYDASAFTKEGSGIYAFRFRELLPDEMDTPVAAWFVNSAGDQVSAVLRYSVASYAYRCYLDRASVPVLNALTQAMMRYGDAVHKYKNGIVDWFDVDAAFAASGKTMSQDVSDCFPENVRGYVINGGTASQPYIIDSDTFARIIKKPCMGTGYVTWSNGYNTNPNARIGGYFVRTGWTGPDKAFTGVVPASKLNDPIYTCMIEPSDTDYYYGGLYYGLWKPLDGIGSGNRASGWNMIQIRDEHTDVINIGAIYPAYNVSSNNVRAPLIAADDPDSTITIHIEDFRMYAHIAGQPKDSWIEMSNHNILTDAKAAQKVDIGWTTGSGNISIAAKYDETKGVYNLTREDLLDSESKQYLLHFWDNKVTFSSKGIDPTTVDGIICRYTVWVEEPEMAGKFVAVSAADLYPKLMPDHYDDWADAGFVSTTNSGSNQLMASRAYLITNEPTVVFSHNIYPGENDSHYDSVVDTAYLQHLIGID